MTPEIPNVAPPISRRGTAIMWTAAFFVVLVITLVICGDPGMRP